MIEEFFKITTKLKKIPRKGWKIKLGVVNPESVADHSYSTSIFAMVLADIQKLDTTKVMKMSLLHDLAESIIGDFTPEEISKNEKNKLENNAIKKILNYLSPEQSLEYLLIWKEYIKKQSDEAVLVHETDKFEMAVQAMNYYNEGFNKEKIKPFFDTAKNEINSEYMKKILAKFLPLSTVKGQLQWNACAKSGSFAKSMKNLRIPRVQGPAPE